MHVGWRRQYGNTGGWQGALAMIGGENWQVAAQEDETHRDIVNRKQGGMGTATPGGPEAPVTASGSGS